MRRLSLPLVLCALCAAFTSASGRAALPDREVDAAEPARLKVLLAERREVQLEQIKLLDQLLQQPFADHELERCRESKLLLKKELEVTHKADERLAARALHLKVARECLKLEKAKFDAGGISAVEYLRFQIIVADAEVGQAREQFGRNPTADEKVVLNKMLLTRRDLIKDKLKALKDLVDAGKEPMGVLGDVSRELLAAELDMVEKPADRVADYARHLKLAREIDRWSTDRYDAKYVGFTDHMPHRLRVIIAEIHLLGEQANVAPLTEADAARAKAARKQLGDLFHDYLGFREPGRDPKPGHELQIAQYSGMVLPYQLELADRDARHTLHRKHIERLKLAEKAAEVRAEKTVSDRLAHLGMKELRLQAEIDFLREQLRPK
jgi:hypothetical protein